MARRKRALLAIEQDKGRRGVGYKIFFADGVFCSTVTQRPIAKRSFYHDMLFTRQTPTPVLRNETQMVIRITVPWYEPFDVETKYFGTYKVQLASVAVEDTSVIQIAGYPVATKHTPKNVTRQICGLSGAFETQEQAIYGWENGFVVMTLDEGGETGAVAAGLVKAMLKKKQAEVLQVEPEA